MGCRFASLATGSLSEGIGNISMISGIKQNVGVESRDHAQAYNRFFEKLSIGNYTAVMNAIVEKVCGNLRYWGEDVGVVSASLQLFLEMSKGYQGCKLLLQLESVDFMLQNHTVGDRLRTDARR